MFDNFVTTVGTNGTITFPLLDASNAGITTLTTGPAFRRNPLRFFVKMPTRAEASRLPAPLKYDRESVIFEPLMLYVAGPLPPHCTASFTRIMSGKTKGKMNKKPIHQWLPQEDTTIYPASPIEMGALRPEEILEFEGSSWFFNPRQPRSSPRGQKNPFMFPMPPERPPAIASMSPVHLMLLVRMKWLPKETGKKNFRVVQGNPIGWGQPAAAMSPEAPELNHDAPFMEDDEDQGSH